MNYGDIIRQERKKKGLNQKELADLINVDRTTITRYENGNAVTQDVMMKIIKGLNSLRLRLEVLGSVIPSYYLDNIDLSPLATKQKAIEEMEEAIKELKNLNLVNKLKADDLNDKEKKQILKETMMALHDVNICINLLFISFSESFEIDLNELEKLSREKMINKGYLNKEGREPNN